MERIEFNLPSIGIGTWKINEKEIMASILKEAVEIGYSLIDTAASYSNEMIIGKSVAELGISRQKLILSDKVWRTNYGYEGAIAACHKSIKKLKTDYLDLYLIHWPATPMEYENWEEINAETWRGLETLYKQGDVRAIGVSNFKPVHLESLFKTASVCPFVNQIEYHPGMLQPDVTDYCLEKGIMIEASSPLGSGLISNNEILKKCAEDESISIAELCLAFCGLQNVTAIPRTTKQERLRSNYCAIDIPLKESTIQQIKELPYIGGLGLNSEEVIDFAKL
ncbi:MAG: aldo/keto reductase [Lachnospiraceae bacterium]|nr:aldo/keto reductase [Lachnospiraceae bacterium]